MKLGGSGSAANLIKTTPEDGYILDVVIIVGYILDNLHISNADVNNDGLVNVLDIVVLIGIILISIKRIFDEKGWKISNFIGIEEDDEPTKDWTIGLN